MMRRDVWWAWLLGLVCLLLATNAAADEAQTPTQDPSSLTWDPSWPTFRPAEYVLTGVAGAAALGTFLFVKPPTVPHWTGGILFDDAGRDAFRLRSPSARDFSRHLSDYTAAGAVVLTIGVDSILIPLLRKSDRVALQLVLMDLEAFAYSTLTTTVLFTGAARARPSYADCQRDPSFDPLCDSGATSSFPSGHANAAFTAAGLTCANHARLPIYGGGAADTFACIGSLTLATTTASLRVLGDRHYVTDVLTSAGIGFGFGYGVPTLLHYASWGRDTSKVSLLPMGGNSSYGLMAIGNF